MKYAVEARIFDSGRIVAKIRKAKDGEENHCEVTARCDIWVDIFVDYIEAQSFLEGYRQA